MRILTLPAAPNEFPPDAEPEALERHDTYAALFEIGAQIQAREVDLDAVLELIVVKAAALVDADLAWLGLVDHDDGRLQIVTTTGATHEAFKRMSVKIGQGLGGFALQNGETVVVTDYGTYLQDTPESVRSAVIEEDVVSVVCAPMLRDDRMVGALYVGERRTRDFGGTQAALVTALAGQASIAIENSQLLEQLETKNRLLEQSAEIHRKVTDAALEQAGLDGVAGTLADLLGRTLVLEQDVAPPFVRVTGVDGRAQVEVVEEQVAAEVPIVAGDETLGHLRVVGDDDLDDLGRRALEHGATVLAVELLNQRTRQEVEWRLGGELLEELLAHSGPVDRRLAARARRFGLNLDLPHRIVVLDAVEAEIDERAVRSAAAHTLTPGQRPVMLTGLGNERVVIAVPGALDASLDELVKSLAAAARASDGTSVSAGVSRAHLEMRSALREALACAKFANLSGRQDAVVLADDMGAMRFLFALDDPTPIQEYVDEQLGPLLCHPRGDKGQLVATLRAYLEADGHHGTIAERCHVHKSTVKYRLRRIGEALDRRLSDPQVRFELRLAVALVDVLEALGLAEGLEARARAATK